MGPDDPIYTACDTTVAEKATPSDTGHLLIRVPVLASCLLGLAFGLTRFVSVLSDDLKEGAMRWPGILLIIVMMGSVIILILLACAAVGFLAGVILDAGFRNRRTARRVRKRVATA